MCVLTLESRRSTSEYLLKSREKTWTAQFSTFELRRSVAFRLKLYAAVAAAAAAAVAAAAAAAVAVVRSV